MKKTKFKRLSVIAICIFSLFSLLIYQFYKIQIIDGDKWSRVAEKQHFFVVREPFLRGTFWSNGSIKKAHPEEAQKLVFDIQKFHLYIDPLSIPKTNREIIIEYLTAQLKLDQDQKRHLNTQFEKNTHSRRIAMWLDRQTKDRIDSWWRSYARKNKVALNALYFVADNKRSYPFGKLMGQVLHTVQNQRDEQTKQAYPTGGLELYFNAYLQGKEGKRLLKRSPRHAFETGNVIEVPEDGADIYLTINHYLQAIAEEEIKNGVKRCGAKCGWVVMMQPKTGEILALAQYPFFYPSQYEEYFNDPLSIEHTKVKAVTDANEPGSIVKPLTIAIALSANEELKRRGEKPLFSPDEKIPCSSGKFPGRKVDLKDTHTHNFLNMQMALQKSSNIYFARLIERVINRLGNEWYREALHETFGLGKKTYIELPSESAGLLPKPGKLHPNGALEWSVPTPFSLAMGHNMQANSIQMLRAHAIFANGGYLVEPTLIRKIVKGNEVIVDNTDPLRVENFPQVLPTHIVNEVVKAMKFVTKPGGTGKRADIWGYTEAGKTGTANKIVNGAYSNKQHIPSFIGFAPVKNPEFVMIVVMDEPECRYIPGIGNNHHGSICAAPVFKEIAKRSFEYLGIIPDDPYGYPVGDPRYNKDLADWALETRQLQEMYEKWNN